jgi:hypothetical protein
MPAKGCKLTPEQRARASAAALSRWQRLRDADARIAGLERERDALTRRITALESALAAAQAPGRYGDIYAGGRADDTEGQGRALLDYLRATGTTRLGGIP